MIESYLKHRTFNEDDDVQQFCLDGTYIVRSRASAKSRRRSRGLLDPGIRQEGGVGEGTSASHIYHGTWYQVPVYEMM